MESGSTIAGRYRLLRRLGAGAMGVVWAATNVFTDRVVALKLIPQGAVGGHELRARMLREARACGRIQHRNVVEIYDVGQTDEGDPFLVMQLLRGETLEQRLRREGPLAPQQAIVVALQIARALAAAHAAGVVHRDLKPANVFLHREPDDPAAVVKVLDFGVSKVLVADPSLATVTGSVIGSPAYMSPEQARGASGLDARSDVWSFGALVFELVAGRVAFVGDTAYAAVAEVLHGQVPRLANHVAGVDPRLDELVARCLEREVARRPDASQLIEELESLLGTEPLRTPPVSMPAAPAALPTQGPSATSTTALLRSSAEAPALVSGQVRRRVITIVAALAVVVTSVGLVLIATHRSEAPDPAMPGRTSAAPPVSSSSLPSAAVPAPSQAGDAGPEVGAIEELADPPIGKPATPSATVKKPKSLPKTPKSAGPTIPDSPG